MNTEIRIDTERLRVHLDLLLEEQQCASELLDSLQRIKRLADIELQEQIAPLIKKTKYLERHCALMHDALEETAYSFDCLNKKVSEILADYIAANAMESR